MKTLTIAATLTALLACTDMGQASSVRPPILLTARLTPMELTYFPGDVRVGARGSFSATFSPFGHWARVRYRLSTRKLTGPALTVHIHTGWPGRNGPVLAVLCDGGGCSSPGASYRAYPIDHIKWVMRILGGYVDVHTKRNPRGELRGQIVIEP